MRKPLVNIIFPGGYFHPNGQFFESSQGIKLIEEIRVNKIFISASGIHENLGITCAKRTALQSAQTHILLADSSKFGKIRPAYFAQLSEIDMVITDNGLPHEWKEILAGNGIDLKIV